MALFIPLIAAMGGNVGVQSAALWCRDSLEAGPPRMPGWRPGC